MWGMYKPFYMPEIFDWWPLLIPLLVFEVTLKGFALWHSARNRQNYWFLALLLVNSMGILPAIYLLFFKPKATKLSKTSKRK